jgi:hypothetical protein
MKLKYTFSMSTENGAGGGGRGDDFLDGAKLMS